MTAENTSSRKTIDADIRERVEGVCRSIMDDHPEVEAIGCMFLSRQLENVLAGLIVGAEGPRLRPEQNVRMFEVWVKIGMKLLADNQHRSPDDCRVREETYRCPEGSRRATTATGAALSKGGPVTNYVSRSQWIVRR